MNVKELTLIIPVYNEAEVIGTVLTKWINLLDKIGINYEIKAFNDGSKDDSLKVLEQVQNSNKKVKVIDKPNSGHGPTILKGYKESLDSEWIFQIDSDDEIDIDYFPELWNNRNAYDFLIGNRKNRNTPNIRKFISWFSRLTIGVLYGSRIFDVNCPYRLMKSKMVEGIITKIPDNTLAPNLILAGMASKNNLKIYEKNVEYNLRTTGEVSIKKWKLLKFSAKSFWQTIIFRF